METSIHVFPDAEHAAHAAAETFVARAGNAIARVGRFSVALAGGSTPRRLYQMLAERPFRDQVDWSRVEVFFGDERCVAPEHRDSNYKMASDSLLSRIPIPAARVHRMFGEREDLAVAARLYQAEMGRVFERDLLGAPPSFDLILLGLGSDGHIASLFPGTQALDARGAWVLANAVPALGTQRLTLTYETLNAARCVLFLACGRDKASTLAEVLEGPRDPARWPAHGVRPVGHLLWFVDEDAAASLKHGDAPR